MADITRHDLELAGCAPEPLMSYLKALGILRLVSEQKDPEARGWWKNNVFWLRSTLDKEALVKFFLDEYKPTPIVAPWAGGSGFFKKDNQQAVAALQRCPKGSRCDRYADVIRQVTEILKNEKLGDKPQDEDKVRLIRRYRRELPDEFVQWMDVAMVLHQDGQLFAPLLGTGGNDGRLDFTQNFMQRILALGLHEGKPSCQAKPLLDCALFASPTTLSSASVGQFAPGRAGGPNATQGMDGSSIDNPWDFVLMMEGTLLLASAAVRRLGVTGSARAAFPFTVRAVAAGFDSLATKDEAESRGELWLPLWTRPASAGELRQLFGEGRAEMSGRPARDGADFARAVAELGVDRGITGFNRFGFLKRSGKAFLAAPLGRFEVVERVGVDLLREADPWLDRFRRAAGSKNAPLRFTSALRRIDSAIFDFCKYGGKLFFQSILAAFGAAERELANAERFREDEKLKPLNGLSTKWLDAACDDSPEFFVARSLAFLDDTEGKIGPLRANLEPVDWRKRCGTWAEKERSVVWNAADLATNLARVLERRMMDGTRSGCGHLPLASRYLAPLEHLAAFIAGDLDDQRIEQLIWGLMLVDVCGNFGRDRYPRANDDTERSSQLPAPLPREYALLKLLFLPRPLVPERSGQTLRWRLAADNRLETGLVIRPESRIVPLLCAGRIGEACRIAALRLRVSGLPPMPGPLPAGRIRDDCWSERAVDPRLGRRLAAALIIPVSSKTISHLISLVCRADDAAAAETSSLLQEKGESP